MTETNYRMTDASDGIAVNTKRPKVAETVLIAKEATDLIKIGSAGIAASIWNRQLDGQLINWLRDLPVSRLPELREIVSVDQVKQAVEVACDAHQTPNCRERSALVSDITSLAMSYGLMMKAGKLQIRLDVDDSVMCPKFHIDNVAARMLCTYRGPATQYVIASQQDNPDRINQMSTGAVGLFKGKKWPSDEQCQLLHRSPEVNGASETRLLLVIDVAE